MFNRAKLRIILAGAVTLTATSTAPDAAAQKPPPGFAPAPSASASASTAPAAPATAATPPPGYGPPPGYAPPGYAPPPGYGQQPYPYPYPPPVYQQPPPRESEAQREAVANWEDGDPVPDGYRPVSKMRKGLVVGGAVMLGSLWLINSLVAAGLHKDENGRFDPLYVPIGGPFAAIVTTNSDSLGTFTLVLDGLVQTGGLAMLIAGIASKQTKLVKTTTALMPVPFTPDNKTVGLGLVGSF